MGKPGAYRLLACLGNPGDRYIETRHNAGFWFAEEAARRHGGAFRAESRFQGEVARISVDGYDCRLIKPATYMNHSGRAVAAVARYFDVEPSAILVVHDEIDLPPGQVKLKRGGGHGGHNGLRDLISQLGSADFARVRIGVGHPGNRDDVVPYVLSRPSAEEQRAIEAAIDEAADALPLLMAGEWDRACRGLHGK